MKIGIKMKKTIEILVGIPCSGKSTFTKNFVWDKHVPDNTDRIAIVSRDEIRYSIWGKKYKPTKVYEEHVTSVYNYNLEYFLSSRLYDYVILDNTHCKEKYIDEIIRKYGADHNIQIEFFDVNLFKAQFRNIGRYLLTGKWIPIKIITQMYKNYKKINKSKYLKYK